MEENKDVSIIFRTFPRSMKFQIRISHLNEKNLYSEIELNMESDQILIKGVSSEEQYVLNFPDELKKFKKSIKKELFNWYTTSTNIVIDYLDNSEIIEIKEEKPKPILIFDFKKPQERKLNVIDDFNELADNGGDYLGYDLKVYKRNIASLMETIEKEFPPEVMLKPKTKKKLAHLLLAKKFSSYQAASAENYHFDVDNCTLEKQTDEINDLNLADYQESRYNNQIENALQNELGEEETEEMKEKKKLKEKKIKSQIQKSLEKKAILAYENKLAEARKKKVLFNDLDELNPESEGNPLKRKRPFYEDDEAWDS
jgi:hypothetical protein